MNGPDESSIQLEPEKDPVIARLICCAIEVQRRLGPGLLESAYAQCLAYELAFKNVPFKQEVPPPIAYRDTKLDCGYRLDFLIEDSLVVELKSADRIMAVHRAQLMSYLKLGGYKRGLLINFNVKWLVDGISRVSM